MINITRAENGYVCVKHVGASAILPITQDGKILLIKQKRMAINATTIEIPAGVLDIPNENPQTCAARELLEETGYIAKEIESIGPFLPTCGYSDEVIHLFIGNNITPMKKGEEDIECIFMTIDEVKNALFKEITDAKTIIAILYYLNKGDKQ